MIIKGLGQKMRSDGEWFIGSLSGEKFKSRATKGNPRRKLPDGRTETGTPVMGETPDTIEVVSGDIEIEDILEPEKILNPPDTEPELTAEEFDKIMGEIDEEEKPKDFEQVRQPPKTTQKDQNKMNHLIACAMSLMSPKPLTKEEKIQIIALLWSDVTDIRVATTQTLISTKHYAMMAGLLTVAVLLKGQGGFTFPFKPPTRQTKIDDAFSGLDNDDKS